MKNFNLKLTQITPNIKNKKNNFYLGAWCLADMENDNYSDFNIHKYHWDDRKKLMRDYDGLNNYLTDNFEIFSKYMGNITDTQNNQRYWKINLGTWLGYIIQILFDRWENIRTLPDFEFDLPQKKNNISLIRSNTVRDFFVDFRSDQWNETVYQLILQAQSKKINYEKFDLDNSSSLLNKNDNKIYKNSILPFKLKAAKYMTKFVHKLQQPEYFIINSYLSRIDEIKLKLFLKEFPLKYERTIYDPKINYKDKIVKNHKTKTLELIDFKINRENSWNCNNEDFLNWFKETLPYFIPCNYSLNFKKFLKETQALPFPKNPKVIFTSVLHIQHDYFNLYTSEKINEGSKYVIGQHGGTFRSAKFNYIENIQKELPDYYLTWGEDGYVDDLFPAKVIPVGNLKISSKKSIKHVLKEKRILLLSVEHQRHSEFLSSVPISSQWLEYYKDLKKFIKKLSDFKLGDHIIIRNKLRKNGWNFAKKISHQFPNLIIDDIADYYKSIQLSSLVISTYNGATYLETMCLNKPTVFFWNPENWELRESSTSDYDELMDVGIFHTSPQSAAEFVNKIYSDIEGWWFSEKVQIAREKFCKKYSNKNINLSSEIKNIFKGIN